MKTRFVALCLLTMACSQSTAPVPTDIRNARNLWEKSVFENYLFDFRQDCNCIYGGMPLTVLVINNKIESITDSNNVSIDSTDYKWFYTIDGLFDRLEALSREHTEKFDYTFDTDYGYPRSVYVDPSLQLADDEFAYTIGNLRHYGLRK